MDTRRISAWMPQVALCTVWRRSLRMYPTYPVAHALVREDDRFCCADFRLYRYSEAPLRTQQTHTSHLCAKALLRKPSTREGLACALFTEKGIESRKASGRSKAEAPLPYREAALLPLKEALLGDREDACTLKSFSSLQTLPMCIFCRQAAPPGSQRRLICLGAFCGAWGRINARIAASARAG